MSIMIEQSDETSPIEKKLIPVRNQKRKEFLTFFDPDYQKARVFLLDGGFTDTSHL